MADITDAERNKRIETDSLWNVLKWSKFVWNDPKNREKIEAWHLKHYGVPLPEEDMAPLPHDPTEGGDP